MTRVADKMSSHGDVLFTGFGISGVSVYGGSA
jgi:hypothetical protein